jgi:hypothetical protein
MRVSGSASTMRGMTTQRRTPLRGLLAGLCVLTAFTTSAIEMTVGGSSAGTGYPQVAAARTVVEGDGAQAGAGRGDGDGDHHGHNDR